MAENKMTNFHLSKKKPHKTEQIYNPAPNVHSPEHSLLCEDCVSQAAVLTWV